MKISLTALGLIVTASSTTALATWHKDEVMQDLRTVRTELTQSEHTAPAVTGGETESIDKTNSLSARKSK